MNQIFQCKAISSFYIYTTFLLILFMTMLFIVLFQKRKDNRLISMLQKELSNNSFCLEQANEEKEWLIKEIHHRVKNNLQIIISLLNTQSSFLTNGEAILALRNSQQRMYAISLIHQKLYQTESLSKIDIAWYIKELSEYLQDTYDNNHRVKFDIYIEPLVLDVAVAVPVGLIINEAISNALLYAFPKAPAGAITIKGGNAGNGKYKLSMADNGVGLPNDFITSADNSLGTNLMAGLAKQIGAVYTLKNNNGVTVELEFEIPELTNNQ
jgi:two-component sensor histidine kinase